jgi:large subunit ribosomal protein L19
MDIVRELERKSMKTDPPSFRIGDLVEVHYRITEGDKERVQIFSGTVIATKGGGVRRSFVVRRIVQGEGVERTFPLHSPRVTDVVVRRRGQVRRAKLYYLRRRVGKAARLREEIGGAPSGPLSAGSEHAQA